MGNIDLSILFGDLGIVGGNNDANNQYEFYYGVVWDDNTITYNQYEFFQKIGLSRYDFFKPYGGEFSFYSNTTDNKISDYKTFYENAGFFLSNPVLIGWILETAFWNDLGVWIDTEYWIDSVMI
jgi:hypothetical protein